VKPTRIGALLALAVSTAVVVVLVAETSYGSLPGVPLLAPVPLVLLAVAELAAAKVVHDRVRHRLRPDGRPPRRVLHPMQVARAAALAKASSPAAALLLGAYGGLFLWTAPRADTLAAASDDVVASGLAALAAAGLAVAALVLERACRVPPQDEDLDAVPGQRAGD
jgi:hypothetical protein